MADTNVFSLQYSSLNGFLFADVGVEPNGMTLSVLSILARRGMDPWQEAERLAKLPQTEAVDGLAQIIATTPASRWSLLDARAIASRLLALLPAIPWRRPLHCLIGAARDQTHDDQGTDLGASFGGAALRTDAESLFLAPSGTAG